jgi:hypothetical protein
MYATHTGVDHATTHLVRAAITAPSVHNTQPWLFTGRGTGLDLYADTARRLPLTDPDSREMVISCGAALFNVRLAMRHLGFVPVVRAFPNPWNRAHLARVDWGSYAEPDADEELMHWALRRRHTHRGPFQSAALPQQLVGELRDQARSEGAELYTVEARSETQRLAQLVGLAEDTLRADAQRTAELTRWTRAAGGSPDGVPLETCTFHPDCTTLASRDFLDITRIRPTAPRIWRARTGLIALITTQHDTREDWLRAGQALQRVLLHAAAHRVMAAFHTQPLELPYLRAQVRTQVAGDQFPQMILRLGHATQGRPASRRPAMDVLSAEWSSGRGAEGSAVGTGQVA